MYYIIYITINIINWKFYLGKHTTDNINDGYLGSGYILKKAIKKYGKENFIRMDIEFLNSEKEVNEREKQLVNSEFLIKFREHCYNVGSGGFGGDNISCHPNKKDIIKRMTQSITKRWKDLEYHDKTSKSIASALRSDSHRKLRSKIAINLWNTKEYRNKTVLGTQNAQKNEETLNKRSRASKRLWENEEYRAKMKLMYNSEKHRKKLSDAAKKLYIERPEIKQQQGKTRSITMQLPEVKKKMSAAAKLRYKTSIKMQKKLTEGRMGEKNPGWGSKWMYNLKTKETKKISPQYISTYESDGWQFGRLKRTKN